MDFVGEKILFILRFEFFFNHFRNFGSLLSIYTFACYYTSAKVVVLQEWVLLRCHTLMDQREIIILNFLCELERGLLGACWFDWVLHMIKLESSWVTPFHFEINFVIIDDYETTFFLCTDEFKLCINLFTGIFIRANVHDCKNLLSVIKLHLDDLAFLLLDLYNRRHHRIWLFDTWVILTCPKLLRLLWLNGQCALRLLGSPLSCL